MGLRWVSRVAGPEARGNTVGYSRSGAHLRQALDALGAIDSASRVAVSYGTPHGFEPIPGAINVLFTMAESAVLHDEPGIRERKREGLRRADVIVTPSRFCADVFREHTSAPIYLCPLGVDTTLFRPADRPTWHPRAGRRFRWIYCGAPNARKWGGHLLDQLAAAILLEHPACELYFKTTGVDHFLPDLVERHRAVTLAPGLHQIGNLTVDARFLEDAEVAALYRASDAALALHCGEGWGLGAHEAMACGLPTVVTDYSGTREFANSANAYLVPPIPHEERGFIRPNAEAALAAVVKVLADPRAARQVGRRAARDVKHLTWGNSARRLVEICSRL